MKEYKYGMRLRGFAPMCQPKEGFLRREDDNMGDYYDVIVYDRQLTEDELRDYELDALNTEYEVVYEIRLKISAVNAEEAVNIADEMIGNGDFSEELKGVF